MKFKGNALPLGKLLRYAVENHPHVAFSRRAEDVQAAQELPVPELERRAERHTKLWLAAGLGEGARVGLVAVPEPETIAAMAGAMRAGLEVALFSPSLGAPGIAATAGLARVMALAGPAEFAGLDYAKRLSEARAVTPAATWLMLWEPDRPRLFRLDNGQPTESAEVPDADEAGLSVVSGSRLVPLDGPGLIAAAGGIAEVTGLQSGATIVSLVSPATPAGLAAGVHAPLVSEARLIWQAPFSAMRLDETLTECARAHLVAPGAIAADLGRAGLLDENRLASLTLIVSEGDPTPYFETDLDPDRVFILNAFLAGLSPLSRLVGDVTSYAEDEESG